MEILERLPEEPQQPCALALGTFDGLHLGHQAVIKAALREGESPLEAAVFTFRRSPSGERLVMLGTDKARLLEEMGVKKMYSMDFSELKSMEAEAFVQEVLFARLNARRLCCGADFRFGRGKAGDAALLERLCAQAGAELAVLSPVELDGEKISSTRIRQAVSAGDMPQASRLLGRPFGFTLEVIHGNHIGGSKLGTPTVNQALPEELVFPRFGVYAAWCQAEGERFYGVCNVGIKPTVGSDRVLAETWMPDFAGDLYGQEIQVELVEFLRPERKFDSLEELKAAIKKNGEQARALTVGRQ